MRAVPGLARARPIRLGCLIAALCAACSDPHSGDGERGEDSGAQDGGAGLGDGGSSAPREPLQTLARGENEPWSLAVDDRYVYWTTADQVRRAPLEGGESTTLATGDSLRRVTAASGVVFFTDGPAGTVSRVDREGGAATVIGRGTFPDGIAVQGRTVVWSNHGMSIDDGTIAAAMVGGASPVILAGGLAQPAGIATDDEFVYFSMAAQSCGASSGNGGGCFGGGVGKVPLAGGPARIIDPQGTPNDVVVDGRGVYWMVTPGPRVMFAPTGGAAQVLAEVPGEDPGPLAVDGDAIYFSSLSRGRVMKLSLDGGTPQPLVTDLGSVGGIAVDDDWVYVAATRQGKILRVAKDGSASEPTLPITGPCPMPLGTAAEIAATPRADPNLELLAMRLDRSSVTASQEAYDRVVADVTAIRAAVPALADVGYFAPHDGKQLLLTPNEMTLKSIDAGQYSAWDCLNDFYGLESMQVLRFQITSSLVQLTLKGLYDLEQLADLYAMLPGIQSAEPNGFGGDGSTICARRMDGSVEYVVDRAGGDCPAGCTTHEAHRFVSPASGVVEELGAWDSTSGTPPPDWFNGGCR